MPVAKHQGQHERCHNHQSVRWPSVRADSNRIYTLRPPTFTEGSNPAVLSWNRGGAGDMMNNWHEDWAFVVVVVHGKDDISRTTRPNASEAEQYTKTLLEQGVPAANIRVYRTRLVRATLPSSQQDSDTTDQLADPRLGA
jgi:hypothetical protein